MKIAILTPSRQRPGKLERLIESIFKTSSNNKNIFCYNYIDNDDPRIHAYREYEQSINLNMLNIYGEPQSVSKSWNVIAQKAVDDGADVLIMGNDDQVYITENWDIKLSQEIKKYNKNLYCMWFEDLINGNTHCAFPIIPRLWYETLGYFTPGVFHFGYNDTWIFDIAKRAGLTNFISDVIVEHRHFTTGKSVMDATYHRNRTQERGNLYSLDKVIFEDTSPQRQEAAEKLKTLL